MTTTISLPTRDCIIIGCDSLATSSMPMVNPLRLLQAFFDNDGKLRLDEHGAPKLDDSSKLFAFTENLPLNQLPNVTKIFSLKPYRGGLLFAGIAGIGNKSIRWLVETFLKNQLSYDVDAQATLETVGQALLDFLDGEFEASFKETEKSYRPEMEIILSGYSGDSRVAEIFKLNLGPTKQMESQIIDGHYDIVFGGQYDVIQRVVKGIDLQGFCGIQARHEDLATRYYEETVAWLKTNGCDLDFPPPDFSGEGGQIFAKEFGGVKGIFSNNAGFSEQAGINFVEFLIATMINAQDFSDRIPTVGGQIHVAIITPASGFKWISKEEFQFQNHSVPRYE